MGTFVLSSTLNYLDRLLLVFLAPLIITDLHITQVRFGLLISVFSLTYSGASLFSGWLLDRFGVTPGATFAVAWWSLASVGTGLTRGLAGLAMCRGALGIGESVGVPAVGKLNANYLRPEERAFGAAANQIGLSVGAAIAPLWAGLATRQGWRTPFLYTGALGFAWVPLWLLVSRRIRPAYQDNAEHAAERRATLNESLALLRSRNLLVLALGTALWMGSYSLWSNWTPLYLANIYHLNLKQVAAYVWIPPLVSNVGGFFGGWLSYRSIKRSTDPARARRRAVWISTGCAFFALLLPLAPDARSATGLISLGFFFSLAGSVNIYALPIDLFGPERTGLAIAALTCAFGIMQAVLSPAIGYLADHHLYSAAIWIVTAALLLSAVVLQGLELSPRESEG